MMVRTIGLGVLIISLIGCMNPDKSVDFETDLISLSSVVDSVFLLEESDSIHHVVKTIEVTGNSSETKEIPEYNILKDLELLKEFDIATPRWADFVHTSVRDSSGYTFIQYTIKNKQAPVNKITFVRHGDLIKSLRILSQKKSPVSQQKISFHWELGNRYTIRNESKLIFRKPSTFTMKVEYGKKP